MLLAFLAMYALLLQGLRKGGDAAEGPACRAGASSFFALLYGEAETLLF
jgi:hypothetical protein